MNRIQCVMDCLATLLQGDGHNQHQLKYKPHRLLHQAVLWDDLAMLHLLLQHDADVDAQQYNVSTHLATWLP